MLEHSPEVIRTQQSGFRWEIAEEVLPHLPVLLSLDGEIIKLSPAKKVTRHHVGGKVWFVKRYFHTFQPLRPYKFYFKPGQARQEWEIAGKLERLGVPTVRHVALGEHWRLGLRESILITEGYPGESLETANNVDLAAVLRFVNQLHERGVLQGDLHPGNLLRHSITGEICLVDVHGTRFYESISSSECLENLAFLRMFLPIPVSEECRHRSEQLHRDYLAIRSERCLKHNRDFGPIRMGRLRWCGRRNLGESSDPWAGTASSPCPNHKILQDPDGFLRNGARLLKRGRSSTVGAGDAVVLKRFNLRKPLNLLKDCFRPSKARRAYVKAYHLELAGIPTARPLATADRRWAGLLLRSYFLMEEIPGATDLSHWHGDGRRMARDLGQLIGKLHDQGFSHRDLKETNLLVDNTGRLFVIDLEGLEFLGKVPRERALQDLARLERGVVALPDFRPQLRGLFARHYAKARRLSARKFFGSGNKDQP